MTLTAGTKVRDLLEKHPFLEDFLASYNAKFEITLGCHRLRDRGEDRTATRDRARGG